MSNLYSFTIGLPNNDILFFWLQSRHGFTSQVLYSRSTDNGTSWNNPRILIESISNPGIKINFNVIIADSNKIVLTYKNSLHYLLYSYDNGFTWVYDGTLPTGNSVFADNLFLSKDNTGNIYLSYSRNTTSSQIPVGLFYIKSTDNGNTWSSQVTVVSTTTGETNPCILSIDQETLWFVYEDSISNNYNIYKRISTDSGQSWSSAEPLIVSDYKKIRPKVIKDSSNKIWIFYIQNNETAFDNFLQTDIYYVVSSDLGNTWSTPKPFTNYKGIDEWHNISLWNGEPIVSFSTSRDYQIGYPYIQLYYGNSVDVSTPPFLFQYSQIPSNDIKPKEPLTIRAFVDDDSFVESVKLVVIKNASDIDTLLMYDDGLHNDSLPGDNIWGIVLPGFNQGDGVQYNFIVYDDEMNYAGFKGGSISISLDFQTKVYKIDVNRFNVPLNHEGVLANVNVNEIEGGRYDGGMVLFSGGFYLSGKTNDEPWANAVASASRIHDYQPGIVGSIPNDPKNNLYVVKSSDPPFGQSWQEYSYAVELGADFYDGNNDGVYNPVDMNGNGTWDLNEDRPDIFGDVTAWCVYNDGVNRDIRRFNVHPQGIEIHQTVFAVGNYTTGPIESMIFIRHRLINKGTVADFIDSVYFSTWGDGDIGEGGNAYIDDLVASDTLLNSGYTYNDGDDDDWGPNPPALFISLLQGPVVYIPGETFIDNNNNGIYDPEIDTPLDTALVNNGLFIGSKVFPGAKNLKMTSFIQYQRYFGGHSDPSTFQEARNYTMGLNSFGEIVDPCTLPIGIVLGVDCNQVNPFFMYSGDPVTNFGWLNNWLVDQRMMVNTGPFELKVNEPVDIWATYVVGRGSSALNSITVGKNNVAYAHQYYSSNFSFLPVDVDDNAVLLTDYHLYQNYPNPFNPATRIRYQIPETGLVTLKVYDILGREVATLVNKEISAGNYEAQFDASLFASGVYFYQLQAGNFIETKKMILLR